MTKFILFFILSFNTLTVRSQIREVDSLKHLLATTKEDTAKVMALGKLCFYAETFETGYGYAKAGLDLARKIGFKRGEAECLHEIGNCYQFISVNDLALYYYVEALKLWEQVGDDLSAGRSMNGIGTVYQAQQDHTHALSYFFKSRQAFQAANHRYFMAFTDQEIAMSYFDMKRLDSALFYYQRSYELYNTTTDKYQLSSTLNGLADVQFGMGNTDLALSYYRLAVQNGIVYGDTASLPKSYLNMARLFKKTGRMDSALHYAKQSLVVAQGGKQQPIIISAGKFLAEMYKNKNDKEAVHYFELAMAASDSTFSAERVLQVQNAMYSEQERQREIEENKLKEAEQRRHNLEYVAIAIGLITFLVLFLALSQSIIVKTKFIQFFGLLGLLAVFEFINLLIHPYLETFTNHSLVWMLIILIGIGALLVPLHHRLETWITHQMVEKNKRIRLAAAKKTIASLEGEQKLEQE